MPNDGHSHHHHHQCSHSANPEDASDVGIEYTLYQKIDLENMECLNEEMEGSGRKIFKPYEKRLDVTEFVRSDCDEELLFNIPFTGNVKLKGIKIIGANDNTHPNKLRIYKNRPNMSFEDVTVKADQEFELSHDTRGELEYAPKIVNFSSVHHLSLHFPSNFGDDHTEIYYIGLRGEFSEAHHHGVTICTYEARANLSDHKNNIFDAVNRTIQ